MTRDQFKLMACGQYCISHLQDSIDKKEMLLFVEASLWSWDFLKKQEIREKLSEPISWHIKPPDITYEGRN